MWVAQAWRNRKDWTLDAGSSASVAAQGTDGAVVQWLARAPFGGEQPVCWPAATKVHSQTLQQCRGKANIACYPALTLPDMDHHALAVQVRHA